MSKEKADREVSAEELGTWIGVKAARIRQLKLEGILAPSGRGKWPLRDNVARYIAYLKDSATPASSVQAADYEKHRARLYKARADKAEIEAAAFAGEFHHGEAVAEVVGDMLANFRARILAVSTAVSPQLADTLDSDVCKAILDEALHAALYELTGYNAEAVIMRFNSRHRADSEAAAEADTEPVE
jgi:hypothetical protein